MKKKSLEVGSNHRGQDGRSKVRKPISQIASGAPYAPADRLASYDSGLPQTVGLGSTSGQRAVFRQRPIIGPEQFPRVFAHLESHDQPVALAIRLVAERLGMDERHMAHDRQIGHITAMIAVSSVAEHSLRVDRKLPVANRQLTIPKALELAAEHFGLKKVTVSKASVRRLNHRRSLNKLDMSRASDLGTVRPPDATLRHPDSKRPRHPGGVR